MSKKYDVVAITGRYPDKNTGEDKPIYKNVGAIIQTQKGHKLSLDATFNPAGLETTADGKVWLHLFEPKPKNTQPSNQAYDDEPPPF